MVPYNLIQRRKRKIRIVLFTEDEIEGYNPTFKVRDSEYVAVGALLPGGAGIPNFSQIYVFYADDDNQRVNVRMDIF